MTSSKRLPHSEAWVQSRRATGGVNTPKLSEEQKIEICQWLATFVSPTEIQRRIKAKWKITINAQTCGRLATRDRWKPLVNRFRQEWVAGVLEIPLAHKRTRLERLARLLEQIDQEDASNPMWRLRLRAQQVKVLEQARLEMDEKDTNITNYFLTQINEYSDEELLRRRDELLAKVKQWRLPNVLRSEESQTGAGPGRAGEDT